MSEVSKRNTRRHLFVQAHDLQRMKLTFFPPGHTDCGTHDECQTSSKVECISIDNYRCEPIFLIILFFFFFCTPLPLSLPVFIRCKSTTLNKVESHSKTISDQSEIIDIPHNHFVICCTPPFQQTLGKFIQAFRGLWMAGRRFVKLCSIERACAQSKEKLLL